MGKSKNSVGIMQGRLTPPKGRGIQFFPLGNWKREFKVAKKLGLGEIEFIFDFYKYRQNPLWSAKGRKQIIKTIKDTGVKVNSICADYFMRKPFFRVGKHVQKPNIVILKRLVKYSSEIGATLIEIPLVDNSSIKTAEEGDVFINIMKDVLPFLERYKVKMGLETDLPPKKTASLIKKINSFRVGANYDTGNSASLGYDPKEELELFGKHVLNIHIKDRRYKGSTVPLGTGDAQFKLFFRFLRKLGYNGSFILQAARGKDGNEIMTTKSQVDFLKKYGLKT